MFAGLIAFLLFSCTQPSKFTEVNISGQYTVRLPDWLERTTQLHKEANLQYQNTEKEFYLVVLNENKKELKQYHLDHNLKSYFNQIKFQLADSVKADTSKINGKQLQLKSGNALVSDIQGEINNESIYYKFAVIETPKNYYQVIAWMLLEDKEKYAAQIDTLLTSFKEIDE